jgi:hypothetical protein
MTISYAIDENDYLVHLLFCASRSERNNKRRRRNKKQVPIIYVGLSLILFFVGKLFLAVLFLIIGLLWFFIYPFWERKYYINHYKGYIKDNCKDSIGRTTIIEIGNEFIVAKDDGNESKIKTGEITSINEIAAAIFVMLPGGKSYIFPKDKIVEFELLRTRLRELADYLNVEYFIDDKWEWK